MPGSSGMTMWWSGSPPAPCAVPIFTCTRAAPARPRHGAGSRGAEDRRGRRSGPCSASGAATGSCCRRTSTAVSASTAPRSTAPPACGCIRATWAVRTPCREWARSAGSQAELLRVPFADANCVILPGESGDEHEDDFVLIADAWVTGWHATELAGIRPADTVAVFGAGAIGLLAAYSAQLGAPARCIRSTWWMSGWARPGRWDLFLSTPARETRSSR